MAEYIEREALFKKALEEKRFVFQMEDLLNHEMVVKTVYSDFAEFVNSIPAADVVEVVRCGQCKHWKPTSSESGRCAMCDCAAAWLYDDFCSYGVRRDTDVH